MLQNFVSRYLPKRTENLCPSEDIYKNIHSSLLHNSSKLETTQMSFNRKMDKLYHIYTMKYSNKEKTTATCNTWMNLTDMLKDFFYMKFKNWQKYGDVNQNFDWG